MDKRKIIISSLLFVTTANALAQQKTNVNDTTIKATTIEITQIYKPQIKQAVKETYNPTLPPKDNSVPQFSYDVPQHIQTYSYKPTPIQPLAITTDSSNNGYKHYIKAGLGNLRTLYADAGLSAIKIGNTQSKVHFGLLSQKGDLAYQQQTVAVLNAEVDASSEKAITIINLEGAHHNFFQYGYDHTALPNQIANRQTLSGAGLSLDFADKDYNPNGWKKIIGGGLSYYTGSNINGESGLKGSFGMEKLIKEDWVGYAGIEGNAAFFSSNTYNVTNAYSSLKIGAKYDKKNILFRAFVLPTLAQNQSKYLLSDVTLKFRIPKVQANIEVGVKGSLTQNTYRQIFLSNPYISQYTAAQTKSTEVFGQIEKAFGHHLTFSARLSWWQYNNLATFVNAPISNSERMLVNYIPDPKAISTQIGMRYQIGNTLSVGAQLSIFNYSNLAANTKVWHTPTSRLNGDFSWQILPELSFNSYLALVSGNYALDKSLNPILLKSYVDMGFGAEYLPMKKLSFFLNFNNLLNSKYERWQGYQAYGINIYGGVRLKF
jgi:hypothetical protein